MLKITNILNPLTGGATTEEYVWVKGRALAEYMKYAGECVVAYGSKIIDLPLDEIYPADTDEYMVMPILEGIDRQSQRILGYMAMSAVSFIPGWGPAAAFIGGNLINLFLQDKEKDPYKKSQSYAWQHRDSPTAAQGVAMPVIYGKARVRPVLKNRYVTVEGDKQVLYALYGIAAHKVDEKTIPRWYDDPPHTYMHGEEVRPIERYDEPGKTYVCIKDHDQNIVVPFYTSTKYWKVGHGTASFAEDIIVNGRAIGEYHHDVSWETRPGLPQQSIILGFDITYSNFAQDRVLYLDFPEISKKTANIRYDANSNKVVWNEHALLLHGESYLVQADAKSFAPGRTYYIYYDQSISTRKYYMKIDTPPTADTAYIIASFKGRATDISTPTYYYSTNMPVSADWYSPVLTIANTHNIELMFEFPYGLYGSITGADITSVTCRLFAQYRELNTGKWINFNAGFASPDHVQSYEDSAIDAIHVRRKKPEIFNISVKAVEKEEPLDYSKQYEMRVSASSPSIVKLVNVATIVYGEENADGSRPGFTYPGEPLLGIKALASGQISGDLDVQVDVERSKVWVYNTRLVDGKAVGWVIDDDGNPNADANNHAWAVYDKLVNGHPDHPAYPTYGNEDAEAVYGCGIDYRRIDYESFRTWAKHTNGTDKGELGYKLNIVFDTFMTAWDAILRVCQEGWGMVYPVGTKIFAFTDKATDVSQVFTMGNIQHDTFGQKYMEEAQKINMVEVTYWDKERNYERTTLATRTANWDSSTNLNVPTAITLYGTTAFEQAWSIARRILMGNELLNNIIAYGVDIDALASQAGDVVEVQHDVLTAGSGGRITAVDVAARSITLDRTLSITGGVEYELTIYHNDSTIERKTVTGGSDTATIVWNVGDWVWDSVPEVYELYSFGVPGAHTKKYRITDISRSNELMRTLTLVQYDEALYGSFTPNDPVEADGEGDISAPKIAPPSDTIEKIANLLNLASNVQLREVVSKNRITGEYESSIVVTWNTVDGDPRGSWEIWFRDVDVSDVDWQGTWEAGEYDQDDKVEHGGKTYISLVDENTTQPFSI